MINTHWLHELVEAFVADWVSRHNKIKIRLFHEPTLLGSAGTLWANRDWVGSAPFFIIYGDNLTGIDLNKMMLFHKTSKLPLTIRVYEGADPERAGIVCLDGNDIVIDFEEKPENPKSEIGAGGIYVADSRIFDFFPEPEERPANEPLDLSYHVLPRMVGKMKAYNSGEFSIDIGTVQSYEDAQRLHGTILSADT
jgi:mannose-1-phosphate guanylyltransferase